MNEKDFQESVRQWLVKNKTYYKRVNDRFQAGIPDFYICFNGRFAGIELKFCKNYNDKTATLSHPLSKKQQHELREIKKSGGIAKVFIAMGDKNKVLVCDIDDVHSDTEFDMGDIVSISEAMNKVLKPE